MIALDASTPLAPVTKKTLVIAMTERCGSTNLCSVLSKLGPLGAPEEFFNPQGLMQTLPQELGAADASDYLARLAARAEVFCFKVSRVSWRPFAPRAAQVFPNARYVWLDRLDLDAQAISLYRARRTALWHANGDSDRPAPEFDAAEIEACREHLAAAKANWARFFFDNDIKPLHLFYEHMQADMGRAVQLICGEAGLLVFQSNVPEGDWRVLRDGVTEAWKQKLRALRTRDEGRA